MMEIKFIIYVCWFVKLSLTIICVREVRRCSNYNLILIKCFIFNISILKQATFKIVYVYFL